MSFTAQAQNRKPPTLYLVYRQQVKTTYHSKIFCLYSQSMRQTSTILYSSLAPRTTKSTAKCAGKNLDGYIFNIRRTDSPVSIGQIQKNIVNYCWPVWNRDPYRSTRTSSLKAQSPHIIQTGCTSPALSTYFIHDTTSPHCETLITMSYKRQVITHILLAS